MKCTLSSDTLIQLFYQMLRIRCVEEEIAMRYKENEMRCPTHLSIGQEGVAVGVCHHLTRADTLVSNHRAHAHYLAKGGNLNGMIAEIYGKDSGCSKGRGGSMHLIDVEAGIYGSTPIVGGSLPVGVGLALGFHMKGQKQITAIFFGEGATEEGVFSESLDFAVLKNLPVLFICENNLYSVYSPLSVRQSPKRSRMQIAQAHGLYAEQGDGNDVVQTAILAKRAIDLIRKGNGPAFLEFSTYRFLEHCGPNDDLHLNYRSQEEYDAFKQKDPITSYQRSLLGQKILSKEQLENIKQEILEEIKIAFAFAKASPFPQFNPQHECVYAD